MRRSIRVARRILNKARWVFGVIVAWFILAATAFSVLEGKSFGDSAWWVVVTGFTIGYGDLFPVTAGGRFIAGTFMIFSFLLLAIASGHITVAILEDKNIFSHEEQERNEAAMLAICKKLDIVPIEFNELPPTSWWEQKTGFDEHGEE